MTKQVICYTLLLLLLVSSISFAEIQEKKITLNETSKIYKIELLGNGAVKYEIMTQLGSNASEINASEFLIGKYYFSVFLPYCANLVNESASCLDSQGNKYHASAHLEQSNIGTGTNRIVVQRLIIDCQIDKLPKPFEEKSYTASFELGNYYFTDDPFFYPFNTFAFPGIGNYTDGWDKIPVTFSIIFPEAWEMESTFIKI